MTAETDTAGMPPRPADHPREQARLSEAFVKILYGLLQAVRIHKNNNRTLLQGAGNLISLARRMQEADQAIVMGFHNKRIYFQESKLIYRRETTGLFDSTYDYFNRRGIVSVSFFPDEEGFSVDTIISLARLLDTAEQHASPRTWLETQLGQESFDAVQIELSSDDTPGQNRAQRAMRAYAYVLRSAEEIAEKLSENRTAGIGKTRRMIQNMVDLIIDDDYLFHALSTIRFYDDYTYSHSVNVAILAMCVGKRIGLSKRSLESLGICGLLHDLGKIEVPLEILNKPGKLTPEEFEEIKKHSMNSTRLIVKIRASRKHLSEILVAPFEHHLKYDLSGYPETNRKKPVSLFGRILTIADVYDAITTPRVYRRKTASPDQALGYMLEGAGKDFDPLLLKVFINMMGVYPVGTLLQLDTQETGLVTIPPEEAAQNGPPEDASRPWIVLIKKDRKGGVGREEIVNLSQKDERTGAYLRNIVRSFNPHDYGIQPAEVII